MNDRHINVDATGTFVTIPARTDLHIVTSVPDVSGATVGDFYFFNFSAGRGGQDFYEVISNGIDKTLEYAHPSDALAASRSVNTYDVEFLGSESSVSDALRFHANRGIEYQLFLPEYVAGDTSHSSV